MWKEKLWKFVFQCWRLFCFESLLTNFNWNSELENMLVLAISFTFVMRQVWFILIIFEYSNKIILTRACKTKQKIAQNQKWMPILNSQFINRPKEISGLKLINKFEFVTLSKIMSFWLFLYFFVIITQLWKAEKYIFVVRKFNSLFFAQHYKYCLIKKPDIFLYNFMLKDP